MNSLEPAACARVLNKRYSLLISMAPLSNEIRPLASCTPPHLGPAIPEVIRTFKLNPFDLPMSRPFRLNMQISASLQSFSLRIQRPAC